MHIEFLVEEPSAEAALAILVPKITGQGHTFRYHPYQGKQDLLSRLPSRMRGYAKSLRTDWRIVVLVDRDRDDCRELKGILEQAAADAGLVTRSAASAGERFHVLNRIAVEELEAWFFGDPDAVRAAYPRVPRTIEGHARYRNPDAIAGGTWEALERVLKDPGYFPGGLAKVQAAREISRHMQPHRNSSGSFRAFRDALTRLAALPS